MKKLFTLFVAVLLTASVFAQSPEKMSYQAVIRNSSDALVTDTQLGMQISIIQGTVDGSPVYIETQTPTTTSNGLVSIQIGTGTVLNGNFSSIDWTNGPYFIKTETDPAGSTDYTITGTSQLLSVPYALHAGSARNFTGNEIKNLLNPIDPQDAATKAYVDQQITNPGIRISAIVDSVFCFGELGGSIDLTITGGTPPYYVEWDNGSLTEDLDNITNGKYQVYVEDSNGLTAFRHFRLNAPDELIIQSVVSTETETINITVSGGVKPYVYSWSDGSTTEDLINVEDGIYTVVVTDGYGCTVSKEIELRSNETEQLLEYLESPASPINVQSINKLIGASDLNAAILTGNPYIIDIRGDEYSTIGHIDGAIQVAAKDVILHLEGTDVSAYDKVVIVDYTGQASSYIASLANMAGHETVSLLWGMSSWNIATAGSWNNNAKNTYATQLGQTAYPKGEEGELPVLETGFVVAEDILSARISEVNNEGFDAAKITADQVWSNPENYYIVNYWLEANYNKGHIPGAIQYTPNESMLSDAFLKTLPTDKTIVVYCYNGQGSAFLSAYLRVLGYDAKSLLFGINGFATDWAADNGITSWGEDKIADYPIVLD